MRRFLERDSEAEGEVRKLIERFDRWASQIDWESFDRKELVTLSEYITMRKELFSSFFRAEKLRRECRMEQLRWSRF